MYIDYVLLIIIELKPHKWIRFEFNTAAQQIRNENDRSQNDVDYVIAGNCVFDLLLDCCLYLYASWLDGCQFFFWNFCFDRFLSCNDSLSIARRRILLLVQSNVLHVWIVREEVSNH